MGRIKSRFVKASGDKIFAQGKDEFTTDFNKNKAIVENYANIPSKKLRNTVVGHITRMVKKAQAEE